MRIWMFSVCLLIALSPALFGQEGESDPYGAQTVEEGLQSGPGSGKPLISITGKRLARLGDRASIALLRLWDQEKLDSRVEDVLPLIRIAFTDPQLISVADDKKPKVTLFLLRYLRGKTTDPKVQSDIQQTLEFVERKTRE